MYEHLTYPVILERMLARVPPDLDKREGSVIYDACAPAAFELAQLYAELDVNRDLFFAETSSGFYLDRRTADFGVIRQPATPAWRKGLFAGEGGAPVDVPSGSRLAVGPLTFRVAERLAAGEYELVCETPGAAGNRAFGALLPIDYVPGLVSAMLTDVLIPGEDEESDAALRTRYLHRVRNPSSGGNAADYRDWALAVAGVGGAKVYPLWDGDGTVKVVIVDSDMQPASETLVDATFQHIESVRPVGAAVTVVSASAKPIHVEATVVLASGYTLQSVSEAFTAAVSEYFRQLAFNADYISIAQIGVTLMAVPGVLDYEHLLLIGDTANVSLASEEIPELDAVDLGV